MAGSIGDRDHYRMAPTVSHCAHQIRVSVTGSHFSFCNTGFLSSSLASLPAYVEPPMNAELRKSKRLFEGEIVGPEAFVVDKNGMQQLELRGVELRLLVLLHKGNQYTGLRDGRVIRFTDNKVETVVRMGSPPYDNCGECVS